MTPADRDAIRKRCEAALIGSGSALHVCRVDVPALLAALEEAERRAFVAENDSLEAKHLRLIVERDKAVERADRIEAETVRLIAESARGWDMPGFVNGLLRGDWRPK